MTTDLVQHGLQVKRSRRGDPLEQGDNAVVQERAVCLVACIPWELVVMPIYMNHPVSQMVMYRILAGRRDFALCRSQVYRWMTAGKASSCLTR